MIIMIILGTPTVHHGQSTVEVIGRAGRQR